MAKLIFVTHTHTHTQSFDTYNNISKDPLADMNNPFYEFLNIIATTILLYLLYNFYYIKK